MSLEELDRFEVTAVRIYRALEELQLDSRPLKEALETVFQPAIALRAIETSPKMQALLEAHTAVERSLKQVVENTRPLLYLQADISKTEDTMKTPEQTDKTTKEEIVATKAELQAAEARFTGLGAADENIGYC
ncbi:hypothetical protein AMTR_s00020p00137290 [Amborella trichopoda]|uniref:Uncharacterized protein n=1 Tax=Amborella trichopoda TaxID=13333 RepID=W1PPC0_AMBTC|nr:hypothetical protein AMTR_s00020p00137290 [Amborella trichopoda]